EKDRDNLKKYCIQYADNFFLDDNTWLLLDDVMKEIPLRDYNPELFLKTTRHIEMSDSSFNYFLFIKEFKIKNMPSPLSFEKDNIRQVIINKRKLKLIEEMKQSVYGQAKEKTNFEVY
ncbi:MAG: peptidyl-prolyl cis-trans isomerase, partial [Bacteroidia bacterium]